MRPKNIAFPTEAKLMHKATVLLGREARRHGVALRQSYVRVAKQAAIMAGRYAHARRFKRRNRQIRFLRTRLGRLIRNIRRKIDDDPALTADFATPPLSRADRVRGQRRRKRAHNASSEVECISKGKARTPCEFGCKVCIATPVNYA